MTMGDIKNWVFNIDVSKLKPDEAAYVNRIKNLTKTTDEYPVKELRPNYFANLLAWDGDAYRYMMSSPVLSPKVKNELSTARYGEQFQWKPEQVATVLYDKGEMGAYSQYDDRHPEKKYIRMFERDEKGVPNWMSKAGSTDPAEASRNLDYFYGKPEGFAPGQLYAWLDAYQKQYDRQKEYTGGAVNATRTFFLPRITESKLRSGDWSGKDLAGDIAENVLYAFPVDRAIGASALLGKGITGDAKVLTKLFGKYLGGPKRYKTAQYLGNFEVPLNIELMDKALYGDTQRGEINPETIATMGATNMGVNYGLGRQARSFANRTGGNVGAKSGLSANLLGSDPMGELALRVLEEGHPYGGGVNRPQNKAAINVLREVDKGKKDLKKVKEKQDKLIAEQEAWRNDPNVPQAAKDRYLNLKRQIEESTVLNEAEKKQALKQLNEDNPSQLYESDYLSDEFMKKYGADENGVIAEVAPEGFVPISTGEHGLTFMVPEERSFEKLKQKAKEFNEHGEKRYNDKYNRKGEGDKAIAKARSDEDIQLKKLGLGSRKDMLKGFGSAAGKSYISNRLGKESMGYPGFKQVGETIKSWTEDLDDDARHVLEDQAMIRMWSDPNKPFVPHKNEYDPVWRAYDYWNKHLRDKTNTTDNAGKKAGLNAKSR